MNLLYLAKPDPSKSGGSRFVFDCETNGFLETLDRVHCLVLKDIDTGEVHSFRRDGKPDNEKAMQTGVRMLMEADAIVGHNVIKFDVEAIKKVYPWFQVDPDRVLDTLVLSRLVYPKDDLRDRDFRQKQKGKGVPTGKLIGSHSLEAWGYRLGNYKGDFGKDTHNDKDGAEVWAAWSPEMQTYCEQDVEVTMDLFLLLQRRSSEILPDGKPAFPHSSVELEHAVAWILARQERFGFLFDLEAAERLTATLMARRAELETALQAAFPPRWRPDKEFTPARSNKRMGYEAGCPLTKVVYTPFNPGSRFHVAEWLQAMRGWEPTEHTNDGHPKVDETILSQLPYSEAKLLAEFFTVGKRLGQLAEGDNAWLKMLGADGRIHGSVNTNGALTGRMTHSYPNMAQVPGCGSPYGEECRSLFTVAPDRVLVGCDASALELRCLAGYMARYDGGAYAEIVLKSDDEEVKKAGGDLHSVNARALGCSRSDAKVWFYAFIYGAGDTKLGMILGELNLDKAMKSGRKSRAKFLNALTALGKLTTAVKDKVNGGPKKLKKEARRWPRSKQEGLAKKYPGFLRGLDGRKLVVRSDHSALNTLLQSAGALSMKKALVILDQDLRDAGLIPGADYEFVANVHDEWQIEIKPECVEIVGGAAKAAIKKAGEAFDFRCPLDGEYASGSTWAATH